MGKPKRKGGPPVITSRRLIVAGGIRSLEEVEALEIMGVDAVVGMAIYTRAIKWHSAFSTQHLAVECREWPQDFCGTGTLACAGASLVKEVSTGRSAGATCVRSFCVRRAVECWSSAFHNKTTSCPGTIPQSQRCTASSSPS